MADIMCRICLTLLVALVLIVLLTFALAEFASSHDAPATATSQAWAYDGDCCSDMDCTPQVKELPDGTYCNSFACARIEPNTKRKSSKDEKTHVCINRFSGRLLCIYTPVQSSIQPEKQNVRN